VKVLRALLVAVVLVAGCGISSQRSLEEITLVIPVSEMGLPYAEFAVADEMGYFTEENLKVKLELQPGLTDGIKAVAAGAAQFVFPAPNVVMIGRSKDLPIVTVFGSVQRYQFGFATTPDAPITKLADLKGKTIGLPVAGTETIVIPILQAAGVAGNDVKLEVVGFDARPAALSQKRVDAVLTWDTELATWQAKGVAIKFFPGWDYLDYMGNGVATSEKIIKEQPDLVRRFLRATVKGMIFAEANPKATLAIVKKRYPEAVQDEAAGLAVLNAAVQRTRSAYTTSHGLGWLRTEPWQKQQSDMMDLKLLDKTTDVQAMMSNQFIADANRVDKDKIVKQAQEYKLP
jgi:NitT/TauT family transport system substrate-binding protein